MGRWGGGGEETKRTLKGKWEVGGGGWGGRGRDQEKVEGEVGSGGRGDL